MPIRILLPRRNNRDLRSPAFQKFRHRRILASVVPHLQNIRMKFPRLSFRKHCVLRLLLRVPRQQHAAILVLQSHNQRIVVLSDWRHLFRRNLRPKKKSTCTPSHTKLCPRNSCSIGMCRPSAFFLTCPTAGGFASRPSHTRPTCTSSAPLSIPH